MYRSQLRVSVLVSLVAAPVLVTLASGCSSGPTQVEQPKTKASASASTAPVATVSAQPPIKCTPDARPPKATVALADRTKGVQAMADGRAQEALRSFEKVLEQNPSDVATFTLHVAATADLAEERARTGRSFGRIKPLGVEGASPPHKNLAKAAPGPSVTIKRGAEERHSGDWFGWLTQHSLENPIGFGDGQMPAMFGDMFGDHPVYGSYVRPSYSAVRYGPSVLVLGQEGKGMRGLQLEGFIMQAFAAKTQGAQPGSIFPEVRYMEVVGSTLIVNVAHEGDGAKVKADGVLLGFDLEKEKALWVSDAGVGNAYSAYATGTHFVTSFTDTTGGKLNVVDVATGSVVASEALPSRVDYIVGQGTKVYAWGYEKAVTFDLSSAPSVPEPKLGSLVKEEAKTGGALEAAQRCLLQNAVIALDHRDGKALLAAVEHLPDDASVTRALEAAGEFMVARSGGTPGLDLTEMAPTQAQYVATAMVAKDAPKPTSTAKRIVPTKDPVTDPPKPPYPPGPRPLYSSMRIDLFPQKYGIWHIESGFTYGDDTILTYGRQFIVTLRKEQVTSIIDLRPLLGGAAKGTNLTPLYFVTVLDGVVYAIVNNQLGGASGPTTSYVVALDPKTGKTLWRTPPGVLLRPFVVFGEFMVVAQNKDKGGELLTVRLSDGQIVSTTRTKESIVDFGWDGRGALFAGLPAKREHFTLK